MGRGPPLYPLQSYKLCFFHDKVTVDKIWTHLSVVLLDGDGEPDEGLVIEPVQAEQVDEHEERLLHLLHVIQVQSVKREPVQ